MSAPLAPPPSRLATVLLSFAPLCLTILFGVLAAVVVETAPPLTVVFAILAVISFVAWPILLWVWLLRGARRAEEATRAWYQGRYPEARTKATSALHTVMRADIRTRALHALGLAAEAEGAFEEAADRFQRALGAMPAFAAPVHKRKAQVVILAHRAFCLAILGRVPEAEALLMEANRLYGNQGRGAADMFLDDASWGMGHASVNHAVMYLEAGREPRAVLALGWAMVFHRRGDGRALHDLCERERDLIAAALLPRERALLDRLRGDAMQRMAASPMRGAGLAAQEPEAPWTTAVLRGSSTRNG